MNYPNNPNYPNDPNNPNNRNDFPQRNGSNNVSNREIFVGLNILSKIGVVFLILGVIAFSAASKGYIPEFARLILVFAVGVIMLITGELFYRKGSSKAFALALIYGGTSELFVSSLIGYYGFEVFSEFAVPGTVLAASVIGFLLSQRYKSQALVVITTIGSVLPLFMFHVKYGAAYFAAATAIMAIHCANAIIARKKHYTAAYITGFITLLIQIPMLCDALIQNFDPGVNVWQHPQFFAVIFGACGAFIYTAEPILNAVQDNGRMIGSDLAGAAVTQGAVLAYACSYLNGSVGKTATGVIMIVMAVIYTITAMCFLLRFGSRNGSDRLFINLALASATVGLLLAIRAGHIQYIALHAFAAAVFSLSAFVERKLLRVWGIVLLSTAELQFWVVFSRYESDGKKLLISIANIVLWLAIMIPFILRKKNNTPLFRAYSALALVNVGILGSNLINVNLVNALENHSVWNDKAGKAAFASLCCAALWLIVGFAAGKLKYMKIWGIVTSMTSYGIGMIFMMYSNSASAISRSREYTAGAVMVIVTIVVNFISVLSVLDITLQIRERAPKFTKAIGLVVSAYALLTLTVVLGTNDFVKFTSFIISIIYIVTAALWIIIGFWKRNAILRRFGLALVLLASTKLFLFDFRGINAMGRTLLFIGFGLTLLGISFGYGIAEKSLKK